MKKIIFVFLSFVFAFSSTIYVAASSNLTYVMPKIINKFNKIHPDIKVKIILSSSGKLTYQILKGSPYDIFLSADMKYPDKIYKMGLAKQKPRIYAKGAIGIFSLKRKFYLKDLVKANSIAISKPKITPYGKAAMESFINSGIYPKIKNKLVFAENIAAVILYVRNYADAGIIANSLIYSKKIKSLGKFYYTKIDKNLYSPINQGAILISNKKEAKEFYEFLFSKDAKKIFKQFGYDV